MSPLTTGRVTVGGIENRLHTGRKTSAVLDPKQLLLRKAAGYLYIKEKKKKKKEHQQKLYVA
jgi:hypothetical protein